MDIRSVNCKPIACRHQSLISHEVHLTLDRHPLDSVFAELAHQVLKAADDSERHGL